MVYAALGLVKGHFAVPRHAETWLGLLMGTATGAITVATGIFVMPGTPYIQALQFERDKMVQALGLSFTVSTVTLALALAYAGQVQHIACLAVAGRARCRARRDGAGTTRCAAESRRKPSGCVSSSACCCSVRIWRCAGSL